MIARNAEEIAILREGGKILASVLSQVAEMAKSGTATIELDTLAEKLIREAGRGYKSVLNLRLALSKFGLTLNK